MTVGFKWVAACLVLAALAPAAHAESVKITFLLVNDFYKMNEEKGRSGMARLAAAVKAERAKGLRAGAQFGTFAKSNTSGFMDR